MNPSRQHNRNSNLDSLTDLLTDRQYLRPHESVRAILNEAIRELGCCPAAIGGAIDRLNLDASRAIGRLRRGELLRLARSIDRFWEHASSADAHPQSI